MKNIQPSHQSQNPPRCVVLDGSVAIAHALRVILTGLGWEVSATTLTPKALADVQRLPTSLLITGLKPSHGCGLRLIESLRCGGWRGRAIILTDRPQSVPLAVTDLLDIAVVLKKPFKLGLLKAAVQSDAPIGQS